MTIDDALVGGGALLMLIGAGWIAPAAAVILAGLLIMLVGLVRLKRRK